jgi:anti-sigma factor RsiW
MTCEELIGVLTDYVAGSLDSSAQGVLEAHLGDCPECLEYLRSYRETIRLARATAAEDAVDEMPAALVEAILAATRRRGGHE